MGKVTLRDTLILSSKRYGVNDISELHGDLNPRVISQRTKDDVLCLVVCIQTNIPSVTGTIARWIMKVTMQFRNVEQCYQYTKAVMFEDVATTNRSMATSEPCHAKALGAEVKNVEPTRWDDVIGELMIKMQS